MAKEPKNVNVFISDLEKVGAFEFFNYFHPYGYLNFGSYFAGYFISKGGGGNFELIFGVGRTWHYREALLIRAVLEYENFDLVDYWFYEGTIEVSKDLIFEVANQFVEDLRGG